MAPSALSPEHHPSHVIELVQWLEDVAVDGSRARVVTLAGTDAGRRTATLRAFYERIVRHPRFGRAWPATLPTGSLAPFFSPDREDTPNGVMWFGLCGSREPVAEPAQFLSQFQAARVFLDHEEWMYQLPYLVLDGVCAAPPFESGADHGDQALGILGDPQGKDSAQIRTILRDLDGLVEAHPLLADGGVLEHDGPRLRARALLAAAWLQRLARRTPVVLVIDEAQHAGPFIIELVHQLAASPASILVVLSGAPDGSDAFVAASGERLAGPLGALAASPVPTLGLPAGDTGRLAGLLATAMPTTLFTRRHLEEACEMIGARTSPQQLLDQLLSEGWARIVDEPVLAFSDDEHFFAARDAALSIFEREIDDACLQLTDAVMADTGREHLLERTVAMRAAAAWHDPEQTTSFETARLLALLGDLEGALALAGAAASPLQKAVVAGWEQAAGRHRVSPSDLPSELPLDAETLIVHAAVLARFHPATARAKLARGLDRLLADDDSARLRFATARIGLVLGDLDTVERALDPDTRTWLTARTLGEIDRLAQWRWQRGFVARAVEVLSNLVGVANLRYHTPDSAALGHFLLGRLQLLEQLDRITTADDAAYVAAEAVTLFSRFRFPVPVDQWQARLWRSWVRHRTGHADLALRELDELAAEQARVRGPECAERLRTLTRKGRCLADVRRFTEAHQLLHEVRDVLVFSDNDPATLAEARQWHAETLAADGDFVGAAAELSGVVAWRAAHLAPSDEELLFSRHRYAFCTLRTGAAAIAAGQMREVVDHRAQLDLADSPRLLAARQSFGSYLVQLGRAEEGVGELQEVVHHRSVALAPDDRLLVDARAELAGCLMVLGRLDDAFQELEEVVAHNSAARRVDLQSLVARQQHALCLRAAGRIAEADAELDAVLGDCLLHLPTGHPFVDHVRNLRRPLAAASATD